MKGILFTLIVLFSSSAFAHQSNHHLSYEEQTAWIRFIQDERNHVTIKNDGENYYIRSNGIPIHRTGIFPNSKNPNAISAQMYNFEFPMKPVKYSTSVEIDKQLFGVALNGVPFDPGTVECYDKKRGSAPMKNCQWREEAIVEDKGMLGLDNSNAHVQPSGAYHYHGVPHGLIAGLNPNEDVVHVGYAADGHKVMFSRNGVYKPSYQLKAGVRPSGPGGSYNGKYTADFEFVEGSGLLDECNGTMVKGEYVYFTTIEFPFIPRCFFGKVNESFDMKRTGGEQQRRMHPKYDRWPPPHHRRVH